MKDTLIDPHWRPQYLFLGVTNFDYWGQFEQLSEVINFLESKFNVKMNQNVAQHKIAYRETAQDIEYHNLYANELQKLKKLPRAEHLYTPELRELVKVKYSRDLELYQNQFGTSL